MKKLITTKKTTGMFPLAKWLIQSAVPVGSLSLSCFVLQIHLILEINPKLQKAPSILKNSTLFVYDFCFITIQFILCMDTDCIQYSSNTMHECTMPILERESYWVKRVLFTRSFHVSQCYIFWNNNNVCFPPFFHCTAHTYFSSIYLKQLKQQGTFLNNL